MWTAFWDKLERCGPLSGSGAVWTAFWDKLERCGPLSGIRWGTGTGILALDYLERWSRKTVSENKSDKEVI